MSESEPIQNGGNFVGRLQAGLIKTGRIMTHPFSSLTAKVTNDISKNVMGKVQQFSKEEMDNLKAFISDGHWSWRVFGFLAGVAMTGAGFWMLFLDIFSLNLVTVVVDAYVLAYGLLATLLEYKESLLPDDFRKTLQDQFLFIYRPYGRCFMYCLFGLLIGAQSNLVYQIIGPFVFGVGVMVGYFAGQAENDYKLMRTHTRLDESHLRTIFNKHVGGSWYDKNDYVESKEFAKVYMDLLQITQPPNMNQLEIAFLEVDADHTGQISYEELKKWYYRHYDQTF